MEIESKELIARLNRIHRIIRKAVQTGKVIYEELELIDADLDDILGKYKDSSNLAKVVEMFPKGTNS